MKLLAALLCATLALVSCADSPPHAKGVGGLIFVPSEIVNAQLSPARLPFTVLPSTLCPLVPSFTTAFDLIVAAGNVRLSLDRVTLHLNDGTNVGSSLTFPQAQLTQLFGSTLVVGNRTFGFRPTFGCGAGLPLSIRADLDLLDASGAMRTISVSGRFE